MIDEEVARDGLALLVTAAAMLIEDAQPELLKTPASAATAKVWAATLNTLNSDLGGFGRCRLRVCSAKREGDLD